MDKYDAGFEIASGFTPNGDEGVALRLRTTDGELIVELLLSPSVAKQMALELLSHVAGDNVYVWVDNQEANGEQG